MTPAIFQPYNSHVLTQCATSEAHLGQISLRSSVQQTHHAHTGVWTCCKVSGSNPKALRAHDAQDAQPKMGKSAWESDAMLLAKL